MSQKFVDRLKSLDVDIGVLLFYVVEKNGVSGRSHQSQTSNHYPATCGRRGSNPGRSGNKRGFYPCVVQALQIRHISISVRMKYLYLKCRYHFLKYRYSCMFCGCSSKHQHFFPKNTFLLALYCILTNLLQLVNILYTIFQHYMN